MKKCVFGCVFLSLILCSSFSGKSQSFETEQLLLNLQKLSQLKSMLEDLKKGYEVIRNGYNRVKEVSEGNFQLHDLFLSHLLEVSPMVRDYYKVGQISKNGLKLIRECKEAFQYFRQSEELTKEEISYLKNVYTQLLSKSANYLADLAEILTSGVFRMSDNERLNRIDQIHFSLLNQLIFLRHFNAQNKVLLTLRAKARNEIGTSKNLYGLTD